ncbi:hypothetical protein [Streptomyces lavendulae]|uniref:hypothetical protein n=1 Tax=Streptomyces lavendulae TaxID=1914 RepID=UPI0024A1BD46|nr:hypothetical protein [Streptomyces lavendulae]GLX17157.1 hypothetical protein Slala01_08010 [Streptomyces lavendulae subsp. lavendulae]GLX29665.1 hypothetical protein Slala02_54850 [Streptomyces lavendulae subsp. lavendulae]
MTLPDTTLPGTAPSGTAGAVRLMKEEAVRRLAGRQAVDLDPRAVARHAGVERATADRLFPDRTALLTALVLDAYNSMGESAERAAAAAEGTGADLLERWVAVGRASAPGPWPTPRSTS